MSVIAAAIIAGATAGLTKVGGEIVSDLYKTLKAQLTQVVNVDLTRIEAEPGDRSARDVLETQLRSAKLDDAALINTAERLIEACLQRGVAMDKEWLVDIEKLVAKKDIVFRDIDTTALLLRSQSVKTDGEFRVEGIKHHSSKRDKVGALIEVAHLQANSVRIFHSILNAVPTWLKIVIAGILFLLVVKFCYDYMTKRAAFDAAVERVFTQNGSGYMSSVNSMANLQSAIRNTRDNGFWNPFTEQWNKHIDRLETVVEPIASGLTTGVMWSTGNSERICPAIESVLKNHYAILSRLSQVPGISVNFSAGTGATELSMFGPAVVVPSTRELEVVLTKACGGNVETIRNPPDLRTAEEKRRDAILAIDEQIAELQTLKKADVTDAREKARSDFISKVAGYYIGMGMFPADAKGRAEQEYDEVYEGSGFNYQIPGVNDAIDRIHEVKAMETRDFDGEVEALEKQKSAYGSTLD